MIRIKIAFIVIFLLAALFRLYGVNWDGNQHFHPDERFLTMVTNAMEWPNNLNEYLDTSTSPLNPHNKNFSFFVYGTFPVFFTKWIAEGLGKGDYTNLTLVGRQLSAFFDLGTVILVFFIAKEIIKSQKPNSKFKLYPKNQIPNSQRSDNLKFNIWSLFGNWKLGIGYFPFMAMLLYSFMVLPIQLSHFYAVDTYLTFFITLSFFILIKLINCRFIGNWKLEIGNYAILLGIAFGLALASKISAVLFLPVIGLGLIYSLVRQKKIISFLSLCLLFIVFCFFSFRLTQPYFFANPNILDPTPNEKVLDNWKQLKSFDDVTGGFPPAVQWITTKPYLFPLKNMLLWGLGLPVGLVALLAISYRLLVIGYWFKKRKIVSQLTTSNFSLLLALLWILLLSGYQGGQFIKALRYFYPIYPFIAIISGYFIHKLFSKLKFGLFVYLFIGLLVLIYPVSFISIYSRPHSRIAASEWIYANIPAGSTVSSEEWDDGLPVSLESKVHEQYRKVQFPLYWPDTQEKWQRITQDLQKTDYVILTSNRLYGSIMTFPQKYPVSIRFYNALFDGSLGFEKAAEFTSRPNIPLPFINLCLTPPFVRYGIVAQRSQECPLPGISFVDDYADETFTVYDHPKVIVFKKNRPVNYADILQLE